MSTITNFKFAELNLRHEGDEINTINLVNRAIRMGYDSVAINIDIGEPYQSIDNRIEGFVEPVKKKQKKQQNTNQMDNCIPEPFKVDEKYLSQMDLKRLQSEGRIFRQFTRITLHLKDTTSVHRVMNNSKIKKFDLIAVRIDDSDMLSTLSRKGEFVDIITFNCSDDKRPSWLYSHKLIQAVAAEGIAFELTYSQALQDSVSRSTFISNARILLAATKKGNNVFLSSGANNLIHIRGPYDVGNLTSLFNFNTFYGIHFVSSTPRSILLRSQAKNLTVKGAMHVGDVNHIPNRTKTSKEAFDELMKIEEFKNQLIDSNDEKMEIVQEVIKI